MKSLKEFCFGYDLENIEKVMDYVKGNYEDKDYEMWIERGDDVMNGLEVFNEKILEDEKLLDLVKGCRGEGESLDWDDMDWGD